MKQLESEIKKCKKCKSKTIHKRSKNKMGVLMALLNFFMFLATGGLWILVLFIYGLCTTKVGGWNCEPCLTNGNIK